MGRRASLRRLPERSGQGEQEPIALVLAGGGARGAYEIGVLSALLPALPRRQRPNLIFGTSVGAVNGAFLAAGWQAGAEQVVARAAAFWERIGWGQVIASPSFEDLEHAINGILGFAGVPGRLVPGLLDSSPLERSVRRAIDFEQIEQNVRDGALLGAAVAATSALTGRSVVFHHGGTPRAERDLKRGIDYVAAPLTDEHVRASAAIPVVFPAVKVSRGPGRGWYFDGGTRLNTPIKPAIWFGARRVIAVGLQSIAPGRQQLAGPARPDLFAGAAQIMQALLTDPLVEDVKTLTTVNELVGTRPRAGHRRLLYIFVAPPRRDTIGRLARRCFEQHYRGLLHAGRSPQLSFLGRLLRADVDAEHGELLSYLFFAPEFARALLEQGREDGRRWLEERHDEGLWDYGPLRRDRPEAAAGRASPRPV